MKILIIALALFLGAVPSQAQWKEKADSVKVAETREKIGLELGGADYDTRALNEQVMGRHLSGVLHYLLDNYQQASYNKKLCRIVKEQHEALENIPFEIKNLKFKKASKRGGELTIQLQAALDKNPAKVKQADVTFQFRDGVSASEAVNEFFAILSHYARMQEEIQ